MLSDQEFLQWCNRLGLSEEAQAIVAKVRSADPARRVGGGRDNVSGRYPSRKMGVAIQFESHRVELAFVYEMEHDPDVLEYFDQAPSIPLEYDSANGRRLSVMHTPDYFVIHRNSAGWQECKQEQELEKLAQRTPHRYRRDQDGRWRCPPGDAHAEPLGLYYRLRSSAQIDWTLQRNIQYLEDYWRFGAANVTPAIREVVQAEVSAAPGLRLSDLFQKAKGAVGRDDIYRMVASGDVYVNLRAAGVMEPDQVRVFPNQEVAAACRNIEKTWSPGQRALFVDPLTTESALPPPPRTSSPLSTASESDLRVANHRFQLVQQRLSVGQRAEAPPVPERTLRLWLARYKEAEEQHGSGYLGLIPRTSQRGNRGSKLPAESRALMDQFIEQDYETLKQKSKFAAWAALLRACEAKGIAAPSYVTFCLAVRRRPVCESVLKRQGRRAAYPLEPFYWELGPTTPRHGDRPFEVGHIDHTELDVELVCSRTGRVLGRPWMTLLTDAFSRRCLSLYLAFDVPSHRSCMMILRECVRRHGRLPQTIVIDGGPEFQSTYFEALLARYECTKKTRPPAKARFGSCCERIFGTTNTRFIHNLRGNTQITRNVRQVTKSVDPREHATWTLAELHGRLSEYLFEVYDTIDHPALGQSPRDAFVAGIEAAGIRPERMIPYDEDFLMATLPTSRKGTARVTPGRGVKINHLFYWSGSFQSLGEQRQVPVRYDPFDAGTAYAFVERHWVLCHSEYYVVFHGRSEKEMMIASTELRRRQQSHTQGLALNARKLADFLHSVQADELLMAQRLRDLEAVATRDGATAIGTAPTRFGQSGAADAGDLDDGVDDGEPAGRGEIYGEF